MQRTGVIADDFTGATDIASAYVARGHRSVVVTSAAAAASAPAEVGAVVVALKTRTAPVAQAVEDSLAALESLRRAGCERFVFKYCSTFDSTPAGNIGPVLDALSDALGTTSVPVVPSFPDNGRTVYQGHLFVGADLLEHSSMRHHPLTPMTESRVAEILRHQTRSSVGELHLHDVRGPQALDEAMRAVDARYVVLDAIDDHDLRRIATDLEAAPLLSGAAGLALGAPPGSAEPTGVVGVTDGVVWSCAGARRSGPASRSGPPPTPAPRCDSSTCAERPWTRTGSSPRRLRGSGRCPPTALRPSSTRSATSTTSPTGPRPERSSSSSPRSCSARSRGGTSAPWSSPAVRPPARSSPDSAVTHSTSAPPSPRRVLVGDDDAGR
ncbi:four-carbon acid sugar kinase family protein [Curtobacterium flaccumfaciens]|nr:four-carbon acid sugar kinase family protein [Curtobacterium flaccumfaciens]